MWVWWYYTSTLKKLKFYRLHSEYAVTSNRQLRCKKFLIPIAFLYQIETISNEPLYNDICDDF